MAGSAKRRLSDESTTSTSNKKAKQEPHSPIAAKSGHMPQREVPDTLLDDKTNSAPLQRPEEVKEAGKGILTNGSYASPPELQTDQPVATKVNTEATTTEPVTTLVSPPTSLADEVDTSIGHAEGEMRPSIEGGHEGDHPMTLHTPTSTSRHSSRQPRQVDRYVPEVVSTTRAPKSAPKPSSSHPKPAGVAVEAKSTSSMKKPSSRPTSSHQLQPSSSSVLSNGKNSSPTVERGGGHDHMKAMNQEGDSTGATEEDLESLRLIRELQEQDFGLRRRGGRS